MYVYLKCIIKKKYRLWRREKNSLFTATKGEKYKISVNIQLYAILIYLIYLEAHLTTICADSIQWGETNKNYFSFSRITRNIYNNIVAKNVSYLLEWRKEKRSFEIVCNYKKRKKISLQPTSFRTTLSLSILLSIIWQYILIYSRLRDSTTMTSSNKIFASIVFHIFIHVQQQDE